MQFGAPAARASDPRATRLVVQLGSGASAWREYPWQGPAGAGGEGSGPQLQVWAVQGWFRPDSHCTAWRLTCTERAPHAPPDPCRDVLNVLGMYPGDPGEPGGDVAGVVTAVGPGVEGHSVGDWVFGHAPGCLGTAVVCSHHTVVRVPPEVPADAACTVPTVFLTADAALVAAALVRPGQRVLIHAATGGLGLAMVQMVAALGAEPVGTAGSSGKRSFLRGYWRNGVRAALNSRATDFAADLAAVAPDGVDMVLNSLTSPGMLAASLAVLHPGGAFVEVGKRDIWSAARIAQERPDVSYHTLAIDFLPPALVGAGMTRVSAMLARGELPGILCIVQRDQSST